MNKRFSLLAFALAGVSVLAACSSDGGNDPVAVDGTREEIIESLTSGSNPLTDEQAGCVADGVEAAGLAEALAADDVASDQIQDVMDITFGCLTDN